MYSLDPRDHKWVDNSSIFSWRQYLKSELLRQRGYVSDYSGKPITSMTGCHMHEGFVTRANVTKSAKGMVDGEYIKWQFLIFHPFNSLLLLPEEHIPSPPSRTWCIQWAYNNYGHDVVVEWYKSLPFTVRPFKLL